MHIILVAFSRYAPAGNDKMDEDPNAALKGRSFTTGLKPKSI
jgi:hypothetical protein